MPQATLDALRASFPSRTPYLMYGLTEAFRSTYLDPGRSRPPAGLDRQGDPERRDPGGPAGRHAAASPGEAGELVHRGALVALGYWNDPERTAERFRPPPGATGLATPELAVWSGDIVVTTRRASCTSSVATTR